MGFLALKEAVSLQKEATVTKIGSKAFEMLINIKATYKKKMEKKNPKTGPNFWLDSIEGGFARPSSNLY